MATIIAGLIDNSAKDNTGDLINGSEVDANPQNLANILDGTVSTALAQEGALVFGADGAGTDITTHGASAGAQMLWDASANTLEVRGATAAGPGVIKLQTGELTNVNEGILGRLEFQAPLDSAGTDAILVGASIWAEVDDTFASGLNDTDLVFAVAESEAALERMRLAWDGTTTNLHFAQIANISSTADITLTAVGDVNIPADIGLTFGDDGEKIEGDGTNLTIASSGLLTLTATGNTVITNNALVSGTTTSTGLVTATAGVTSGSNIISDADSTDDLGTASVRWANVYTDSIGDTSQDLTVAATTVNLPSGHIFDYSGGDVVITHSSGVINVSTGALQVGGVAVTTGAGVSLSGSGNDNIVTVTGANAMLGESNLNFDGSNLLIANGGGLVVGHTAQETISVGDGATDLVPEVQVLGTAAADATVMLAAFSATATTAGSPILAMVKSGDSAIDGTHVVVTDGEELGNIIAYGDDGTDLESVAAQIQFEVDGTPGTGDMPGRIIFATTADGAETATEKMRIHSTGAVTKPLNPYVNVRNNSTDANVTGDSSAATVDFDEELVDIGDNFASDTFTAPVDGVYVVCGEIELTGMTTSHDLNMALTTSLYLYRVWFQNASSTLASGHMSFPFSAIVNMDAGDTLSVTVTSSGAAKVVDIVGAPQHQTYMTIQLAQ